MKKKMITMLLTGVMAVAVLSGCGKETEGTTPTGTVQPTATTAPTDVAEQEEPTGEVTNAPTEEAVQETEPVVTLGDYMGLKLYEVDSQVIAEEMNETMLAYAELVEVNRAAAEGDTVNINYVGTLDGVAFEGGTYDSEEGYDLELGSGAFIPGFEDGLIGAVAGEVRDLNLTFPEDYGSAELAGKAVVFTVTVNAVMESVVPELTDEFASENFGCDTVAEYILALYAMRNEESYMEQIWDHLLSTSTVENYPQSSHDYERDAIFSYYNSLAEYYGSMLGVDTETFLTEYYGFGTMDVFYEMCEDYARDAVMSTLILAELAERENITISEEDYQQSALQLANSYGYEDLESFEEAYGEDEIFKVISEAYVMEYIINNAEIIKAEGSAETESEIAE